MFLNRHLDAVPPDCLNDLLVLGVLMANRAHARVGGQNTLQPLPRWVQRVRFLIALMHSRVAILTTGFSRSTECKGETTTAT